jgi:ubiquinone/menaquinone biosynthesis C-methylase UbiE
MIDEARQRSAAFEISLEFEVGDAGHLPWDSNFFDACRADRVFQHLPDPQRALTEMIRVLKPGGRVLVIDRDWGMTAVDASDAATTRVVLNRVCSGIRNGWIGRQLWWLFQNAGVINPEVGARTINIQSFDDANTLLDLLVVLEHAVAEKLVSKKVATQWVDELLARNDDGTFFATMTLYMAWGSKNLFWRVWGQHHRRTSTQLVPQ